MKLAQSQIHITGAVSLIDKIKQATELRKAKEKLRCQKSKSQS